MAGELLLLRASWMFRYLVAPVGSDWERTCLSIVCCLDDMLKMEQVA